VTIPCPNAEALERLSGVDEADPVADLQAMLDGGQIDLGKVVRLLAAIMLN
jgi:hypothetical protein